MTTLTGRHKTALLVIDVQNDVVAAAYDRDGVIANIAAVVQQARSKQVPVVWVQHADEGLAEGTTGWQFVPQLQVAAGEPVVHKRYGDSFEDTDLAQVLADRQVGHVVVTGAQTDACIRSTLHGAFARGYDTTLVEDAHTTEDLREWGAPIGPAEAIAYTNLYWQHTAAPGKVARTLKTADVTFS